MATYVLDEKLHVYACNNYDFMVPFEAPTKGIFLVGYLFEIFNLEILETLSII